MGAFALRSEQLGRVRAGKHVKAPPILRRLFALLPAILLPRYDLRTGGAMRRIWRLQKEGLKRNADHFFSM
jgi:hypothetical protein